MLKKHSILRIFGILAVFGFSIIWTTPAFADDNMPPPTETPVSLDGNTNTEEILTVAELLTQLPEGTDLVVTDETGNLLPLAGKAASKNIVVNDPMWCPAGVVPGTASCSPNYTSLEALVSDFNDGSAGISSFIPSGNGTIWIQSGEDISTNRIEINGNDSGFSLAKNFNLALRGGWSGGNNTVINPLNPTEINSTLGIINWNSNVTLSDIKITDSDLIVFSSNDSALLISTTKNISLNRVIVEENENTDINFVRDGAYLNNSLGNGNVIIKSSAFNNNEGAGLKVYSSGIVSINAIIASHNTGDGAYINNSTSPTGQSVIMNGLKQFNNNTGNGLVIYSNGAITLNTIVANYNGKDGVKLDNRASTKNLSVTLEGTNYFTGNIKNGLEIWSHGLILVNNINASHNGEDGAILENCDSSITPWCTVLIAKPVHVTGINTFDKNGGNGLTINSFGGITLSRISASENFIGAFINNDLKDAFDTYSTGTITLSGYGTFNKNDDNGVALQSHGNITAVNLTTLSNGSYGAGLTTEKNVIVNGINNFSGNQISGLYIYSNGKISLNNISTNGNSEYGAHLVNNGGFSTGIVLNGINTFSSNELDGLHAASSGTMLLYNITAQLNGGTAVLLNNDNNYNPSASHNITLLGTNLITNNLAGAGLEITSYGAIRINNLNVSGNADGVSINAINQAPSPNPIIFSGYLQVNNNGNGLYIDRPGQVTITNISANNNAYQGAFIHNSYDISNPQNVVIKGVNSFNNNLNAFGLEISTYGSITLSNISANSNGSGGVNLDNCFDYGTGCQTEKPKNIIFTGTNSFNGNGMYNGLLFSTSGSIYISHVYANSNNPGGIKGTAAGNITIACGQLFDNAGPGYELTAAGVITLSSVYSGNNGSPDSVSGSSVKIIKSCLFP